MSGRIRWIVGAAVGLALVAGVGWLWLSQSCGSALTGIAGWVERCRVAALDGNDSARAQCAAVRALARAIAALEREPSLDVGGVWFLQKLYEVYPDEGIRRVTERGVEQLAGQPDARLINPQAPRPSLPSDPGRGILRLSRFVLAPLGTPVERAARFIADFVATDETGYVLTHQFLVLEWARELGLDLPEAVRGRRRRLLEGIAREQAADGRFSDLFVERAAILARFASDTPADADRWVRVMLHAQRGDGSWVHQGATTLAYDGQAAPAAHPRGHTTAIASNALGFYLHRAPRVD